MHNTFRHQQIVPKRLFPPIFSPLSSFSEEFLSFSSFKMANSDPNTSNGSAGNNGHISGEELEHTKVDNGDSIKIEGALWRGNSHCL